jgi:hypothetical protein
MRILFPIKIENQEAIIVIKKIKVNNNIGIVELLNIISI